MSHQILISKVDNIEKIATFSKLRRLFYNPIKYVYAIVFKEFIYPKNKKEIILTTKLFYGKTMQVALPAATDIYLTGGKSHSSEIRLAKFLILNLNSGSHFLDIGAHFGYFSLIGSELVGDIGSVKSFEPAGKSYDLLAKNAQSLSNIEIHKKAVSDKEGSITFFEFPNLQSEYNASDVSQFEQEDWFQGAKPVKVEVAATTIDNITSESTFKPDVIKIDVEGAEFDVIKGGARYLTDHSPKLVMEYLEPKRKNESHKKALDLLSSLGYGSFVIANGGELNEINNIDDYLIKENLESDNIVFIKTKK